MVYIRCTLSVMGIRFDHGSGVAPWPYALDERQDNVKFEQWLGAIDALVADLCGMSHADFADAPYYDNWADGVTPDEMLSVIADYDEIFAAIQSGGGI